MTSKIKKTAEKVARQTAKVALGGLIGAGGFLGLFALRNDLSAIPATGRSTGVTGIDVHKSGSTQDSLSSYVISTDIDEVPDVSAVTVIGLDAEKDTVFKQTVLNGARGKTVELMQNPCLEGGEIRAFHGNDKEEMVARRYGVDALISAFSSQSGKPVMIFFPSTMLGSEPESLQGKREALRAEVGLSGITEALISVFNAADQNDQLAQARKHYGQNLLVIPEPTGEELNVLALKLRGKLSGASSVQVVINGHHLSPSLADARENGITGTYKIGEGFSDQEFLKFLRELPVDPQRLTVVHGGCNVRTDIYEGVGNHVVIAPYGTAMTAIPNLFGKVQSPIGEIIPLLAREASPEEIQQFLQESAATCRQSMANQVQRLVDPQSVRHLDWPISPPIVVPAGRNNEEKSGQKL